MNRGAVLFDDANVPVFDEKTLAILQEWRKLLEEGIVPGDVFTMGEADYIDAFTTGKYAYSPQQIYDLKVFNDPAKSQVAGQVVPVPVDGQPWGIIDEGIYTVPAAGSTPRRNSLASTGWPGSLATATKPKAASCTWPSGGRSKRRSTQATPRSCRTRR